MFPDGNSSIARLLVRSLIPDPFRMAADADPFGIVTARLDYGALDGAASPAPVAAQLDGRPCRERRGRQASPSTT